MRKGERVKDPCEGVFESLEFDFRLMHVLCVRIPIPIVKDDVRIPPPILDRQIVAFFFLADQVNEDIDLMIRDHNLIFSHRTGPSAL